MAAAVPAAVAAALPESLTWGREVSAPSPEEAVLNQEAVGSPAWGIASMRGAWRHRRDVDVARDADANNAKRIKGRRKSTFRQAFAHASKFSRGSIVIPSSRTNAGSRTAKPPLPPNRICVRRHGAPSIV